MSLSSCSANSTEVFTILGQVRREVGALDQIRREVSEPSAPDPAPEIPRRRRCRAVASLGRRRPGSRKFGCSARGRVPTDPVTDRFGAGSSSGTRCRSRRPSVSGARLDIPNADLTAVANRETRLRPLAHDCIAFPARLGPERCATVTRDAVARTDTLRLAKVPGTGRRGRDLRRGIAPQSLRRRCRPGLLISHGKVSASIFVRSGACPGARGSMCLADTGAPAFARDFRSLRLPAAGQAARRAWFVHDRRTRSNPFSGGRASLNYGILAHGPPFRAPPGRAPRPECATRP